jgi:hypothetical protein
MWRRVLPRPRHHSGGFPRESPCTPLLIVPLSVFSSYNLCIRAEPAQSSATAKQASPQATTSVIENYGKLPLSFEPNQGQTDPQVKFLSRGNGYSLFLTPTEAVLALQRPTRAKHDKADLLKSLTSHKSTAAPEPASPASVLTMKLVGGNASAKITGGDQQPGKSNYFIGNDPKKWHTNVSNYSKVEYRDVYPGIDLVYYGNQRQLEHDFIVAPGADAKAITLAFHGARKMSLNRHGDLVLATRHGQVQLKQPLIYQNIAGVKQSVTGRYILKSKNRIGFAIAAYDHASAAGHRPRPQLLHLPWAAVPETLVSA